VTLVPALSFFGPPLALFLNNQGLVQNEFRAAVYVIRVAESAATTVVFLVLGLFSADALHLAGSLVPAAVVGVPVGMVLLRRLEPEAFRRLCMGANCAFIAFGLARSCIEMKIAPMPVAYGLMAVVTGVEMVMVTRFFLRRRVTVPAGVPAKAS